MQGKLNAHRLLRGTGVTDGYLDNLNVTSAKQQKLRQARDEIRLALRAGLPQLQQVQILEQRFAHLAKSLRPIQPRFRMQGSAAYHTLNDPAHRPPQEIDYDDGVYLPMSFVSGNGAIRPPIAAKALFRAVETILEPLCRKHGWKLNREKSNCVRVDISSDAHVDLPLYAIPDEEFTRLTEAARATLYKSLKAPPEDADLMFSDHVYGTLPSDRIMLAQREGTWIESDPRKIENWFDEAIKEHNEGLRYVCRYFKGWRDYQWEQCRLTSLAIMACVVKAYDSLAGTLPDDRDDTALVAIADKMPALLSERIENPVIPGQWLDDNWTMPERAMFVQRAKQLRAEMHRVLDENDQKGIAIEAFRALFGSRIPDDDTLLRIDGAERDVRSYAPATVAAPNVRRTTSG